MSYKNYIEKIRQRNQNLIRYHEKHPEINQESLARIFKIDQSRVSRILKSNGNKPANNIMVNEAGK